MGSSLAAELGMLRTSTLPGVPPFDWDSLDCMTSMIAEADLIHQKCTGLAKSLRQRRPSLRAISSHLQECLHAVYESDRPLWVMKWTRFPDLVLKVVDVVNIQRGETQGSHSWDLVSNMAVGYIASIDVKDDPYFSVYLPTWTHYT